MYNWKIILTNGKEYIVSNNIQDSVEMMETLSNPDFTNTISTWDLATTDKNKCKSVAIFSSQITSVEYNLK